MCLQLKSSAGVIPDGVLLYVVFDVGPFPEWREKGANTLTVSAKIASSSCHIFCTTVLAPAAMNASARPRGGVSDAFCATAKLLLKRSLY